MHRRRPRCPAAHRRGLPASPARLTTGTATVTTTGGVNATVTYATLFTPGIWTLPPGAIALSWRGNGTTSTFRSPVLRSPRSCPPTSTGYSSSRSRAPMACSTFRSSGGECLVTISPALADQMGGCFTCLSVVSGDGAFTVNAQGSFSAQGSEARSSERIRERHIGQAAISRGSRDSPWCWRRSSCGRRWRSGGGSASGPDEPVYLWWARIGAAQGISLVGGRPGTPALIPAVAGTLHLPFIPALAGLEYALGAAVGLATVALVRGREAGGRCGLAARGPVRRHVRGASRRGLRRQHRVHGDVRRGGGGLGTTRPSRHDRRRAPIARWWWTVAPAVLPGRRGGSWSRRASWRGSWNPNTGGAPTVAGCWPPSGAAGPSSSRAWHRCTWDPRAFRSTRRGTGSCDGWDWTDLCVTPTWCASRRTWAGTRRGSRCRSPRWDCCRCAGSRGGSSWRG